MILEFILFRRQIKYEKNLKIVGKNVSKTLKIFKTYFLAWKAFFIKKRYKIYKQVSIIRKTTDKVLKKSFLLWKQYIEQRRSKIKLNILGIHYNKNNKLNRVMNLWEKWARWSKQKKALIRVSKDFRRKMILKKCFRVLNSFYKVKRFLIPMILFDFLKEI